MQIANPKRGGFTLIELMVVIVIISILVGLLSAGVLMFMNRGKDAQNASEIGQLVTALGGFKTQFGIYPPSRIRLVESCMIYTGAGAVPTVPYYNLTITNNVPAHPLDFNSYAILKQMFPRILWGTAASPAPGVDWNGDGNGHCANIGTANPAQDWHLQGDQCLVFFLSGIPNCGTPGPLGFSTSPSNPSLPPSTTNQQRIGPLFTFSTNRLASLHANSSSFYSYLDVYGTPFAYFSASRGLKNQYNPYFSTWGSDCSFIGAMPYCAPGASGVPTYCNPDTFQIISAGADQFFGSIASLTTPTYPYIAGSTANPANAIYAPLPYPPYPYSPYIGVIWDASKPLPIFDPIVAQSYSLPSGRVVNSSAPGIDDRTNFSPGLMGAGNAQN